MAQQLSWNNWLKQGTNISLSTDTAVVRIRYEGLTDYDSLTDYDKKSILALQTACQQTIPPIPGANAGDPPLRAQIPGVHVPMRSLLRLTTAVHAAKYYRSIGRPLNGQSLHYNNVLSTYEIERKAYESMKDEGSDEKVPLVLDKDGDRKIINWIPSFRDYCTTLFGAYGPISYIIRENSAVPDLVDDPLLADSHFGSSGSMIAELEKRLPHTGPIHKQDNATVYVKIASSVKGTTCESTIKPFMRTKDGRGAFLALLTNHAGDIKYRSLYKKSTKFLSSVTWNGNNNSLENHVSKHRRGHDQIVECADHIPVTLLTGAQKVEYLLDSIVSTNLDIVTAQGLIRNDTVKRANFESAASTLIEVDPFVPNNRNNRGRNGRNANVSQMLVGGRGKSGVDLRWHSKPQFRELKEDQKDELMKWLKDTPSGRKCKADAITAMKRNRDSDTSNEGGRKKFKATNPREIMSCMAALCDAEARLTSEDEDEDDALETKKSQVASMMKTFPNVSTKVKLSGILKSGGKTFGGKRNKKNT